MAISTINEVMTTLTENINQANTWEEMTSLWTLCSEVEAGVQWLRGDIADRVVVNYGESGLQRFASDMKVPYNTLVQYRRVARAYKGEERNYNVTFSHYLVASMADKYNKGEGNFETDLRKEWLEKAEDNSWSVDRLRNEIKAHNAGVIDNMPDNDVRLNYVETFVRMVSNWTDLEVIYKEKIAQKLENLVGWLRVKK
jgi:hypothetical protein